MIAAAEASPIEIEQLSGKERALLYRLAVFTGFRRAELASLRPSSFNLVKQTVTVQAGYTKNGDEAVLPLNASLVPLLRERLEGLESDEPLFPGLEWKKTWLFVRTDLKAAGLPLRTPAGIRNFHALRNTYISMLLEGGVDPKIVQLLARHSDINLTLAYARPQKDADVRAINQLRLPGEGGAAGGTP